jgi:toxin-antitoxin system PIN domain toxin
MIVVDANLLLYAVVTGFEQHDAAHAWWEEALNGQADVGLTSPAIFGFLRISTNPRILTSPLPVDKAAGYVTGWLDLPNVSYLIPGPRHLDIAFDLLHGMGTAGNLTTDVQLAAFAIEHDADMCSNDNDFGRFPRLRWVNPLT